MSVPRMLAAALAVAALAAPTAVAKPIDAPPSAAQRDMHASVAEAAAAKREKQEQRARNASGLPAYPSPTVRQREPLPGPPTWPLNPKPITSPPAVFADDADEGLDWATIGIGVGLTFVALGAFTGVAHRIRLRRHRPRIAG